MTDNQNRENRWVTNKKQQNPRQIIQNWEKYNEKRIKTGEKQ